MRVFSLCLLLCAQLDLAVGKQPTRHHPRILTPHPTLSSNTHACVKKNKIKCKRKAHKSSTVHEVERMGWRSTFPDSLRRCTKK